MQKRSLKELNLLDDFLFGSMVNYPGIGEEFSRELLKIIFQKEFGKLTVVSQKMYYGADTNKHGARLDVYLEEELTEDNGLTDATVYDIEPDNNDAKKYINALPKRVRFYHAKIDGRSLKAGEDYHALKNVIIVMITPYDPFQLDRMMYTIKNTCVEEPDMPYEDGAKTLFLYTKGTKGNPSEALKQLLHYMEHTQETYAVNDELKKIQKLVDIVKRDEEVSLEYMKIFEREAMLIDQGRDLERENTKKAEQKAKEAEQKAKEAEQRAKNAEQRTKAQAIIELLQEYDAVPDWLKERIMEEQSMETLSSWLKVSAKADSIHEFLQKTGIVQSTE